MNYKENNFAKKQQFIITIDAHFVEKHHSLGSVH